MPGNIGTFLGVRCIFYWCLVLRVTSGVILAVRKTDDDSEQRC